MHYCSRPCWLTFSLVLVASLTSGCERKETVLDIETPDGQVEVERSLETGALDIEVTDNEP